MKLDSIRLISRARGREGETECSIMPANNFFVSHHVPEQTTGVVPND